MASTVSFQGAPQVDSRPFYCHQCSHHWMKTQNSLFECPRCREGFIEEVTDDFRPDNDAPQIIEQDIGFGLFSSILDLTSPNSEVQNTGRSRNTARRGGRLATSRQQTSRSRSPRVSVVVESFNGNRETRNRANFRVGLGGAASRFFSFALDDIMNTIFTNDRTPAMTSEQLQEIPRATISAEQTELQCAICFDDFKLNELEVRKLLCNHYFHENCIFPWLRNNASCPVCRSRLPNASNNNDAFSDTDEIASFIRIISERRRSNRSDLNTQNTEGSSFQLPFPSASTSRSTRHATTSSPSNSNAQSSPYENEITGRRRLYVPPRSARTNPASVEAPTTRSQSRRINPNNALIHYEQPEPLRNIRATRSSRIPVRNYAAMHIPLSRRAGLPPVNRAGLPSVNRAGLSPVNRAGLPPVNPNNALIHFDDSRSRSRSNRINADTMTLRNNIANERDMTFNSFRDTDRSNTAPPPASDQLSSSEAISSRLRRRRRQQDVVAIVDDTTTTNGETSRERNRRLRPINNHTSPTGSNLRPESQNNTQYNRIVEEQEHLNDVRINEDFERYLMRHVRRRPRRRISSDLEDSIIPTHRMRMTEQSESNQTARDSSSSSTSNSSSFYDLTTEGSDDDNVNIISFGTRRHNVMESSSDED